MPRIDTGFLGFTLLAQGFLDILAPDRLLDITAGGHTNKECSPEIKDHDFGRIQTLNT